MPLNCIHRENGWLRFPILSCLMNCLQSWQIPFIVSPKTFFLPPDSQRIKLPMILFIHGGPVAQDEFAFDLTRQMLAAKGYAVAAVNYRGSSGRGLAFTKSIYADWGNREVMDILGAADYLVAKGIADPDKL